MRNLPERDGLVQERRHVPGCHHVLNASAIRSVQRSLLFRIQKYSFGMLEPRRERRNEKHLYPHGICKGSNASRMVDCHVVEHRNVAKRQGKVFDDSTECLVLLYGPSPQAKLRAPNEFNALRTDDDILVLFGFDFTYYVLPVPRIPKYAPTVSSEAILNI